MKSAKNLFFILDFSKLLVKLRYVIRFVSSVADVWHLTASSSTAIHVKKLTQEFIMRGHSAQFVNETRSAKFTLILASTDGFVLNLFSI